MLSILAGFVLPLRGALRTWCVDMFRVLHLGGCTFYTRWIAFEDVLDQVRRDQNIGLIPKCESAEDIALESAAHELADMEVAGSA